MAGSTPIGFDSTPVASETTMKAMRWVRGMFGYLMSWVLLGLLELRYGLSFRAVMRYFVGCQHSGRPWFFLLQSHRRRQLLKFASLVSRSQAEPCNTEIVRMTLEFNSKGPL